ncbi:MAG: hypothetical protein II983_00860, partial [Firmicutes bacterium]|nr:hypothetical protein [Bacillota bacterium]
MKRIYKTRITRMIALTLTFCMVFHMLPVNIFADDITSPGAIGLEIEDLELEIQDLESQIEELFTTPTAIEDPEPVTAALMTTAVRAAADTTTATQEYVVDGTTIGTFTFDVTSQTNTKYT